MAGREVVIIDDDDEEENQQPHPHVTSAVTTASNIDNNECAICLEPYNTFDHRAAAFQCGHIFGEPCVQSWMALRPNSGKLCPLDCSKKKKWGSRQVVPLWNLPTITVGDAARAEKLEKKVKEYESEIASLKQQVADARIHARKRKASPLRDAASARPLQPLQPSLAANHALPPPHTLLEAAQQMAQAALHLQTATAQHPVASAAGHGYATQQDHSAIARHLGLPVLHSVHALRSGKCVDMCFDNHNQLFMAASGAPAPVGRHEQQQILLLCINQTVAEYTVQLPSGVTMVKDLKLRRGGQQMIAAAHTSGLVLLDNRQPDAAACFTTPDRAAVWSCTYADQQGDLLYAGTEKGRVAVFDIRRAGLVQHCVLPCSSAVHTVVALPRASGADCAVHSMLAATSTALWHVSGARVRLEAETLVTSPAPGLTCGSLACDEAYQQVMLSWRAPAASATSPPACHQQFQMSLTQPDASPAQAGPSRQPAAGHSVSLRLFGSHRGHVNQLHMIRSTFLPPAFPGTPATMFLSATEAGNRPQLLDCRSGIRLAQLAPLPSAVSQLSACRTPMGGAVLLAASASLMHVHTMANLSF